MVLSEEEKRLRKNAHQRKYYKNNVEKERTRVEKWQEDNREHYNEKARIRFAEYRKTPEGYKMTMVSRWKQMGLIGNYEKITTTQLDYLGMFYAQNVILKGVKQYKIVHYYSND